MKLIHMSDLHLVKPGERLWGLNPFTRLEVALHDIARNHGDADLLVITGDLADQGEIEAYEGLRELLARFPIRTALMLGSHDNRENFFQAFPDAPRDPSGFAQYAEITHQGLFIFLDTVGEMRGPGIYCEARQAWLSALLADYRDVPVYLFSHHTPFNLGVPMVDQVRLANAEEFGALLRQNAVQHLFFGHAHRASICTWQGILCSGVPGISFQYPLVDGSVTSAYSVEPPMYAVVRIEDDGTMINYDSYMHRHSADMRGYVPPAPENPVMGSTATGAAVAAAAATYQYGQYDQYQQDELAGQDETAASFYASQTQTALEPGDESETEFLDEDDNLQPASFDSAVAIEDEAETALLAEDAPLEGELEEVDQVTAAEASSEGDYWSAELEDESAPLEETTAYASDSDLEEANEEEIELADAEASDAETPSDDERAVAYEDDEEREREKEAMPLIG